MLWRAFSVISDDFTPICAGLPTSESVRTSTDVGIAFIFTGQGAQYVNMGLGLLQYPIYEAILRRIDDLYRNLGCEWSIFGEPVSSESAWDMLIHVRSTSQPRKNRQTGIQPTAINSFADCLS